MADRGETETSWRARLRASWTTLAGVIALLWLIEIVDTLVGGALDGYGIRPREVIGLPGILAAPFLHASFVHLVGNTIALFFLGGLVLLRSRREFFWVSAAGMAAGVAVWLFGRGGVAHIGSSGVIFAYLGFLFTVGFVERRFGPALLSLVVGLVWGSTVNLALPTATSVSWEGHLAGLLCGIAAAIVIGRSRAAD